MSPALPGTGSFWFGLVAALAGNGGLWYLLHETSDYHFYQHPQLWVIPAAISVLIAAHLNRKILYVPIGQLSPTKLKKLRVVHVLDSYERREEAKDYLW